MKRSSGILMPVFSLPSPYGIGTMGKEAFAFLDFLKAAGQTYWQVLPVGPTAWGNSPYQSPSAFAGNPFLIDLDLLIRDGLLKKKEVEDVFWGNDPEKVAYEELIAHRIPLLKKAVARGLKKEKDALDAFLEEQKNWLPEYALFMALKEHFGGLSWMEWPEEAVRLREESALQAYRRQLAPAIEEHAYIQFLFFRQWRNMRAYAKENGIRLIGDMPLYVSMDSADVWASPENFLLDERRRPTAVAGVPPDYFSADGQLWGNPLYDYAHMKQEGYGWWIRRIGGAEQLFDVLRIDHFRGWDSFWAVPCDAASAKEGHWVKGPGMDLVRVLLDWFSGMEWIAEDLGEPSPGVQELLRESGLPGMVVLEFAFSEKEESSFLPHRHVKNSVCYLGTHDNEPVLGWKQHARKEEIKKATQYLGLHEKEGFVRGMLRGGAGSVSDLFIAQMQDYLELGPDARINTPGTVGSNWQWRMRPGLDLTALAAEIAAMTRLYGR